MTPNLIGYATADWHIPERRGGGAWSSFPEVSGDSLHALRQVVALCRTGDVPLFAAGDLIDGPDPDPGTIAELYDVLRELTRPVYYVLGNHERGRDWLAPLGSDKAVCLDDRVYCEPDDRRITVSGFSYVNGEKKLLEKIRELGGFDAPTMIGLYHQQWNEFLKPGKYRVSDLPRHELAICGDVHVRQLIETATGPRLALSPGPLSPQSAAESQPHAAYAIHSIYRDGNLALSVQSVPLTGRAYLTLDVDSEQSAENALKTISSLGGDRDSWRRPVVSVRLSSPVAGFVETTLKLATQHNVHVRFYGKSSARKKIESAAERTTGTLASAIAASQASEEVKQLASKLTESGANPREILARERAALELQTRV